jgi:hypothetical protein
MLGKARRRNGSLKRCANCSSVTRPYFDQQRGHGERLHPFERAGKGKAKQIEAGETTRRADKVVDDSSVGRGELLQMSLQPAEIALSTPACCSRLLQCQRWSIGGVDRGRQDRAGPCSAVRFHGIRCVRSTKAAASIEDS